MSLHLTKLWSYVKDEDLQQMAFALELFGLRLLTTWAWWFSPGHFGFHLGIVAGNLIQVGVQVQDWKESSSISSTALLCWLEEGLCNPALRKSSAPELCLHWVSPSFSSRGEIAEFFQLDEAVELGNGKGSGEFSSAVAKAFPHCC